VLGHGAVHIVYSYNAVGRPPVACGRQQEVHRSVDNYRRPCLL